MDNVINIVISAILGGAAGAFLYNILHNFGINRRVAALEVRQDSLASTVRGAKGNEAQAAAKEREQMAISEGIAAITAGGDIKETIKALAIKYPDVAAKILKQFGG